ncbi:protein kinase [Candidatus Woesearchaeota archaeon]|nr:protein kinase [Candidatus Woesearchaeota archaeon]
MSEIPELKEFGIPNLDNYEILSYIGRGEWTPVFLAKRKTDSSKWALKFLRPSKMALEQMVERGWTEDDYWKKESLNGQVPVHPNIANNFVDQVGGERFLAERYVGERFLEQYLEGKKSLPLEEIIQIGRGLASALDVQHTLAGGEGMAHGDVTAKNIAYTFRGDAILTDFGNATIGESKKGRRGSELTRAIEEFSLTGNPTKQGDVFSFGSILYRLFTGKYIFENEFEKFEKPEEFMNYLRENPKIWDKTIDEKVNSANLARPFDKLIKRCLYSTDRRISDGHELAGEFEKTVRKYQKSRPWAILKRYGLVTAAALAMVIGGAWGYDSLSDELAKQKRIAKYEEKIRMVKLFDNNAPSMHNDWESCPEHGTICEYIKILEEEGFNKIYAYAAYLNPELTFEALQAVKDIKVDPSQPYLFSEQYRAFREYLFDKDQELYNALSVIEGGGADNLSRMLSVENQEKTRKRWQKIKEDYKKAQERKKEMNRDMDFRLGSKGFYKN